MVCGVAIARMTPRPGMLNFGGHAYRNAPTTPLVSLVPLTLETCIEKVPASGLA